MWGEPERTVMNLKAAYLAASQGTGMPMQYTPQEFEIVVNQLLAWRFNEDDNDSPLFIPMIHPTEAWQDLPSRYDLKAVTLVPKQPYAPNSRLSYQRPERLKRLLLGTGDDDGELNAETLEALLESRYFALLMPKFYIDTSDDEEDIDNLPYVVGTFVKTTVV